MHLFSPPSRCCLLRSCLEYYHLTRTHDKPQAPELIPGQRATVVVTIEDNEPIEQPHVIDILKILAGHRLYQSAEEVGAYIREERDAWEC